MSTHKGFMLAAGLCLIALIASGQNETQEVTAMEYFFDHDPGPGAGYTLSNPITNIITVTGDYGITVTAVEASLEIEIPGSLAPGSHTLYVRALDEQGRWTIAERRSFYVLQTPVSQSIIAMEYFFDSDPGSGSGFSISNPGTNSITVTDAYGITVTAVDASLDIEIPESLTPGFHTLYVRALDEQGGWSIAERRSFYLLHAPLTENVVAVQIFLDNDPGAGIAGNGAIINVTPISSFTQTIAIEIPPDMVDDYHYVYIRTQDEHGTWSVAERRALVTGQCSAVSQDQMLNWWTMDDMSRDVVRDVIGNRDGTLFTGVPHCCGWTAGYAQFNGLTDFIRVTDNDIWAFGANDFTIELLANFQSSGNANSQPGDNLIGQSEGSGAVKKWTLAKWGGQLIFRLSDGNTTQDVVQAPFTPNLDQWYHLALTRSLDTFKLYVDGQLLANQIVSTVNIPNVSAPLTIGFVDWQEGGDPGYLEGKMDEVTIYGRALTPAEVGDIATAEIAGKCRNLQIVKPNLSDVLLGSELSYQLEAVNGYPLLSWSVAEGALPDGVALNSNGVISGTPSEAGVFAFNVQVEDDENNVAQREMTIRVLLTLPDPQFSIFKSGTSTVPGRVADYFIFLENLGNAAVDLNTKEFLDPWFTYAASSPTANITSKFVNTYTPDPVDSMPAIIEWPLQIQAGESSLITYQVRLHPGFSIGEIVTGSTYATVTGGSDESGCHLYSVCLARHLEDYMDCIWQCQSPGYGDCSQDCFDALSRSKCYCEGAVRYSNGTCGPADCNAHPPPSPPGDPGSGSAGNGSGNTGSGGTGYWGNGYGSTGTGVAGPGVASSVVQGPADPNEKLVLAEKYISPGKLLPYVIHFENIGNIEAQSIFITDTLDEDLDEATLNIISVEGASFDQETRILRWQLYDINLAPDSSAYVLYTIYPKPDVPSGTVIHNTAYIQFEVFDVFPTNQTENIIDYTAPEGVMEPLPDTMYQTAFQLFWSGTDAVGEIESYSIFVSENGSGYELLISNSQDTSAIFIGETGKTYRFICIAKDLAGNVEIQEPISEASTYLDVACTDTYYYDGDGDGFGNTAYPSMSCTQPDNFVPQADDCQDFNPLVNPNAPEICNLIDDDCDGEIDEGATTTYYLDADGDSYGDPAFAYNLCYQPEGLATNGNDCDDTDPTINPGATEVADGQDNDCDGQIDEDLSDLSIEAGSCYTVYLGYAPAECTDLTVLVSGGSTPYAYAWSNGSNLETTSVCPSETTVYGITVTDADGFSAQDVITVHVLDVRCGNNNDKVVICHSGLENLCIASNGVQAHLDHGDALGICNAIDPCGETESLIISSENTNNHAQNMIHVMTQTDHEESGRVVIYPNPASTYITLQLPDQKSLYEINILDTTGKVVRKRLCNGDKQSIPVNDLANGAYLVEIITKQDRMAAPILIMH